MEDILLPAVPKLIQSLYHHISCKLDRDWDGDIGEIELDHIYEYYRSHNPDDANNGNPTIQSLEKEYEALKLTRDLAAKAVYSYTGQLMSAVNYKRSQLIPVQRLPEELLSIIFGIVGSSRGNYRFPLIKREPLNLTAVSRTWREVALNTPRLWTKIDAFNARIAPLFIKRSKQLPLQIEIVPTSFYSSPDDVEEDNSDDYSEDDSDGSEHLNLDHAYWSQVHYFSQFIELLIPHRGRWSSLTLQPTSRRRGTFARKLTFPVFHLETFCLTSPGWFGVVDESHSAVNLFSEVAPRLRDLHLAGHCLPLSSAIFHGLTSLHLERIRYNRSSVYQLLRALNECPDLEKLALIELVFPPFSAIHASSAPIIPKPTPLHSLQKVVLRLPTSSFILRSIHPPPTVHLEMDVGDHFQAYFPDTVPNASRIGTLFVKLSYNYAISGWTLDGDEKVLNLEFDYEASRPDVLRSPSRILFFPCLESLALRCLGVNISTFAEILRNLPTITTLSLSEVWFPPILASLIITPSSHLAPRLRTLRIDRTPLRASTIVKVVKSRLSQVSVRASESESGEVPLDRLILSRCYEKDHKIVAELATHIKIVMEDSNEFPLFL
ncbi:hypothetical protein BOTBODRAFT_192494 [Botryobasidium botryosum FD-172 SS1]|uniref:F-box domain-containing protein n=1 Tax=Botryobasidium botryosum (strain FD-172 SS1) TaxID=930990 RepID=A0A067LY50_BOTB1|nr:hypothetical protein BOTBODRAFT_192494 [Botryobasidium botryosum FD-172 SS1]